MTRIVSPANLDEFDAVRALMRAFIAWHHERHHDQMEMVKGYFDEVAFEAELAGLAEKYREPDGALLLGLVDDQPAGCVALRRFDVTRCEMKRMFVDTRFQGRGLGKALGRAIMEKGRELGYRSMVLDSGAKQHEAHSLYRSLGFEDIEPYYDVPDGIRDWLVYMKAEL